MITLNQETVNNYLTGSKGEHNKNNQLCQAINFSAQYQSNEIKNL